MTILKHLNTSGSRTSPTRPVRRTTPLILFSVRVILVQPQEPGNVGSAARVMKNFGLSELYLVDPQCELTRDAYALATHAADVLDDAVTVSSTLEAVADRRLVLGTTARARTSEGFDVYTPRAAAKTFAREDAALMFGPERAGLSNEDLDLCHAYIRIPTGDFASLNLAQAVNLVAYEFFVSHAETEAERHLPEVAPREALERLHRHFLEVARYIGYTNDETAHKTDHMYRRIFDRARLTGREVAALHGLWRQAKWAVDHGGEEAPAAPSPTTSDIEPAE